MSEVSLYKGLDSELGDLTPNMYSEPPKFTACRIPGHTETSGPRKSAFTKAADLRAHLLVPSEQLHALRSPQYCADGLPLFPIP
jgi:hypothetical protein